MVQGNKSLTGDPLVTVENRVLFGVRLLSCLSLEEGQGGGTLPPRAAANEMNQSESWVSCLSFFLCFFRCLAFQIIRYYIARHQIWGF